MSTLSIHDILDKADWNYDQLKLCLEKDASSINTFDQNGFAPLHRILVDEKCTPDVIRLLIHHRADVNLEILRFGTPPLEISLWSRNTEQEGIIKELLDGGADLNKLTSEGQSLLCIAMENCDINVILMLIEAGCPLHSCPVHKSSVMKCFTDALFFKPLNVNLLKLLMEKCRGLDLNILEEGGSALFCHVLYLFPGRDKVNFLLESGFSWNACELHDSPWECAIDFSPNRSAHVTNDLVQLLIEREAKPTLTMEPIHNSMNETVLNCALKYCSYEMSAIQLMLDKGVAQIGLKSQDGESVMHAAVSNFRCEFNPKIVKFLIDRGANVNAVDDVGSTPLHSIMRLNILMITNGTVKVKALLKNGALVNEVNLYGNTPLKSGIDMGCNHGVLQLLLNAGAKIYPGKWTSDALSYALARYTAHPFEDYNIRCCKLLIKHSLIDDPSIDINLPLFDDGEAFVNECQDELQRMESINIHQHCTLRQLIDRSSQIEMVAEDTKLNRLIQVLVHNKYPVYFDVICATIDREDLEPKLQKIVWYGVKSDPEISVETNVFLNADTISKIASFLSDEEALNLLISSHILGK